MKTIRNSSTRPLKISLPGGKVLHLGPARTGQVSEKALERPAVKKLLEAGEIEVIDETGANRGPGGGSPGGQESTHGWAPGSRIRSKGDR